MKIIRAARSLRGLLFVLLMLISCSLPAQSAPEHPEVYVQLTPHFRFEVPWNNRTAIVELVNRAEQIRGEFCAVVPHCFSERVTVRVTADASSFLGAQPGDGHIDWARGIAYASRNLILLRLDQGNILSLEETFEHEVSHLVLLKSIKTRPPQWFIEGLAIYQARQDLIPRFEEAAGAAVSGNLIPLSRLNHSFPRSDKGRGLAYAQSGLFLHFLVNEIGQEGILKIVSGLGQGRAFPEAFILATGRPVEELEKQWLESFDGFGSFFMALRDDWWLWSLISVLFVLAVVVKLVRIRKRKQQMNAEDREKDWEYRGRTLH